MKYYLLAFLFSVSYQICFAQDTVKAKDADTIKSKVKDDGEIKLSDKFLKALDGAFSFGPVSAPMPKQNELTKELLHEWVGEPTAVDTARQTEKFDSTYKALRMWEKEFYKPLDLPPVSIDMHLNFKVPQTSVKTLDVNSLGKFVRPKEYRLYKVRKIADRLRPFMNEAYPLEGPAWIEKKKGPAQKEQDLIIELKDSINSQKSPQELRP